MAYKLIYIEDLNPDSIVSDLANNGFEVRHFSPGTFEKLITEITKEKFDAILLDFRLTQGAEKAIFDAPTIAQMQRTKSANNNTHFPIFLISSESNISSFYEDFTSNDLFDFSIAKEVFQLKLGKSSDRLKDIIDAYRFIPEVNFDLGKIVGLKDELLLLLDYRFLEKINDPNFNKNTYKIARVIYNTLVRSIGSLIGEDVLSARLGIKKTSEDWLKLKQAFDDSKYTGIFSSTHERWWANEVESIANKKFGINSLRRLKSDERKETWAKAGFGNLDALEKLEFAESSNFWTICKDSTCPIDPIDGLELISKDIIPWQEKEYISILAAMKSSKLLKMVKPHEHERFQEFAKSWKK